MASPKFPEPPNALPATSTEEIDNALNRLNKSKETWLDVSAEKRVVLLQECLKDLMTLSEEWIGQSSKVKAGKKGSAGEGEEWIGLAVVVRGIQMMVEALKANGQPKIKARKRADGQEIAEVYPRNFLRKGSFGECDRRSVAGKGQTDDARAHLSHGSRTTKCQDCVGPRRWKPG